MTPKMPHSNQIFVEEGQVLSRKALPGKQFIIRLSAKNCAANARPGTFAHLQCDPEIPMRRPLSIMRADAHEGWVEFLFKDVGLGTHLLGNRKKGDLISIIGPIGNPFELHEDRPTPLLLGGGVGIPPMIFVAESTRRLENFKPFLLMGSEVPFPFPAQPSQIIVPGLPGDTIAAMPLMEDWGIPSRLASLQGYPGCFNGYITEMARIWLTALPSKHREEVEIFACGPDPMLEATARLASEFDLPCQLSLEEYMACAVGGCAGCVVETFSPQGRAMKRVCVDGPVFQAKEIYP